MNKKPLLSLSWGCGVQSTALAVMSALGDLPMLDVVITADTGWERKATYDVRDYYTGWLEKRGIPVHVVTAGNVRVQGYLEHVHIPFWTDTGGPLQRQCTMNFKIVPIKHELRRLLGYHQSKSPHPVAGSVVQWLGISLDEYKRMKDSRVKYIIHKFPLIEKRLTRNDCIEYLESKRLPVPIKSACVGCPYRRSSEWLEMKKTCPDEWAEVIAFDELNRNNPLSVRGKSTAKKLYVYQKSVPLISADLKRDAKRERKSTQLPLICETGYCHV
jgi:hypothetical protein